MQDCPWMCAPCTVGYILGSNIKPHLKPKAVAICLKASTPPPMFQHQFWTERAASGSAEEVRRDSSQQFCIYAWSCSLYWLHCWALVRGADLHSKANLVWTLQSSHVVGFPICLCHKNSEMKSVLQWPRHDKNQQRLKCSIGRSFNCPAPIWVSSAHFCLVSLWIRMRAVLWGDKGKYK